MYPLLGSVHRLTFAEYTTVLDIEQAKNATPSSSQRGTTAHERLRGTYVFAIFCTLCLQYFTESTFALFPKQAVLYRQA